MKLYYSPGACSLAVHIVLLETHRRFDLERVDLKTHRTASGADFYAINPKGYVPVLELGSERLTEASVVLQYVADLEPNSRLVPPPGTFARYRLQELLSFLSTEIHKQFGPLFKRDAPESYNSKVRGRIAERYNYLQDELSDRAFLTGETFTIADAYLFTLLRWSDQQDIDLLLWPNLADYEDRVLQRPSVIQALDEEGLAIRHRFRRSA
ncbi:MAG: glutathione transferase GstA [Deltaproteobacteria bacterium]|nr:glutathione transferase GstA [Deltaproteobacteria bacterium]